MGPHHGARGKGCEEIKQTISSCEILLCQVESVFTTLTLLPSVLYQNYLQILGGHLHDILQQSAESVLEEGQKVSMQEKKIFIHD